MSAGEPVGAVALIGGVAFATDTGTRLTAGAEIGGLAANFTSFLCACADCFRSD